MIAMNPPRTSKNTTALVAINPPTAAPTKTTTTNADTKIGEDLPERATATCCQTVPMHG